MKKVIHFKGLNGLRAIAALSVLFGHTTIGLAEFGLNSFIFGKYQDGNPKTTLLAGYGVSIFFVLSGFLITFLLLEEKAKQEINIKNFYIRRILRIWPLYYLYFLVSILTLVIFQLPFDKATTLFYIFFTANIPFILSATIQLLSHYWSIGVEEQFYSFWPWLVKKVPALLKNTISICVLLILVKSALHYLDLKTGISWPYTVLSVTRFHCMLIGAIGAILYFRKNSHFIKFSTHLSVQLLSWFSLGLVAFNYFHIASFIDTEIISLLTVFIIIGQAENVNRIINLEIGVFDFLGKISYGIYVIHPVILFYLSRVITKPQTGTLFNYLLVYLSVFSLTILLAYLSYEFYEKKFLKLKSKYTSVKSSGTKNFSD